MTAAMGRFAVVLTLLLQGACASAPPRAAARLIDDVCAPPRPAVRCISGEELRRQGGDTGEALRMALWSYTH